LATIDARSFGQLAILTSMENLMVIRVEVIAPEKPLDVNNFSKNIVHVDSIICKHPKISFMLIWSIAIAKILMLI
jgi:hypothetical protein